MATLRAGVLIIGSLLWESELNRPDWRRECLDVDAAEPVPAPIRYGRVSSSRRNTYTMAFSMLCNTPGELGVAHVVPCRSPISSGRDFQTEVERLARAEGLNEAGWTWGAVGVLVNPQSTFPDEIRASWEAYFTRMTCACRVFDAHLDGEQPSISRTGTLALDWPISDRAGSPIDLDLLFATPAEPKLRAGSYPSAEEVATAYVREDLPEYFIENVLHGIRTVHDPLIWQAMVRMLPDWATRYAKVDALIHARP